MKLLDVDHPFFAPRWRRVTVVAVCVGWAIFEWTLRPSIWAALATALALYTIWALLVAFDPAKVRRER